MPGWLKIILIIFGLMALVLVGLSVGGYYYFRAHGHELKERAEKLRTEGEVAGKGKTASDCLEASIARIKQASGLMNQVRTQIFFTSCVSVAADSPELCATVPPADELMATGRWSAEQCAKRGLTQAQTQACAQLYNVVAQNCHSKTSR